MWRYSIPVSLCLTVVNLISTCCAHCNDAPDREGFNVCQLMMFRDNVAVEERTRRGMLYPNGTERQNEVRINNSFGMIDCRDLDCLCDRFYGTRSNSRCILHDGLILKKAVRKEYRMLTDEERQTFHHGMQQLKADGLYDVISRVHAETMASGGAHGGPAFLPWHREFLKRVEISLRNVNATNAIPYWDTTLEERLQNPADSILWTDMFMGESSEFDIITGPFAKWSTFPDNATNFRRNISAETRRVITDDDIEYFLNMPTIDQLMVYTAARNNCNITMNYRNLEYLHNHVHSTVGGHMGDTLTAASDPIFYLLHSFLDLIWEQWRHKNQNRKQRTTQYPMDNLLCEGNWHFIDSEMSHFEMLKNRDGLSNIYTDNMYEYAPRPSCDGSNSCGSKYLFCAFTDGPPKCTAKIKPGGNCATFTNGEKPCFQGECIDGICFSSTMTTKRPMQSFGKKPPSSRMKEITTTMDPIFDANNKPYVNLFLLIFSMISIVLLKFDVVL